jgi:hypothetical protein
MKDWIIALLIMVAFLIVGLVDRPEYYHLELKDVAPVYNEGSYIKMAHMPVEKPVEKPH